MNLWATPTHTFPRRQASTLIGDVARCCREGKDHGVVGPQLPPIAAMGTQAFASPALAPDLADIATAMVAFLTAQRAAAGSGLSVPALGECT